MIEKTLISSAYIVHFLSLCTWIGAMFFNLVLQFPLLKSRSKTISEYAKWMGQQATLAAKWLYLCVVLTLSSGLLLAYYNDMPSDYVIVKIIFFACMLSLHLFSSFYLWPRIFLSTENELKKLFFLYRGSIWLSSTTAIGLVGFSYT